MKGLRSLAVVQNRPELANVYEFAQVPFWIGYKGYGDRDDCSSDVVVPSLFPVYLIRFNLKSCGIHSCHIHSTPSTECLKNLDKD
jgi:hypothetical protein